MMRSKRSYICVFLCLALACPSISFAGGHPFLPASLSLIDVQSAGKYRPRPYSSFSNKDQVVVTLEHLTHFILLMIARDRALNGTLHGQGWPGIDAWKTQPGLNGLPGPYQGLTTYDANRLVRYGNKLLPAGYNDSFIMLQRKLKNTYPQDTYLQTVVRNYRPTRSNSSQSNQVARTSHNEHLPVLKGVLTSLFGYRTHPISRRRKFHYGIDIGGNNHCNIYATGSGQIVYSSSSGGYGKLVKVLHDDRRTETRYAHCSSLLKRKGTRVTAGDIIAKVGTTGYSTGPHIHFEVRKGNKAENPLDHFPSLPKNKGQRIR